MNLQKMLGDTFMGTAPNFQYENDNGWQFAQNPHGWQLGSMKIDRYGLGVTFENLIYQNNNVCDLISFSEAIVSYFDSKGDYTSQKLDLSEKFIIKKYSLSEIKTVGISEYWFGGTMHSGSMLVFGYELDSNGKWSPIKKEVYERPDFMPDENQPQITLNQQIKAGEKCLITMAPLRVVLCIEFICLGESNDFEPTGSLKVATVHPHAMLMMNSCNLSGEPVPENKENASIIIDVVRPSKSNIHHAGNESHPYIKSALFADQNDKWALSLLPSENASWDLVFAYYLGSPEADGRFYNIVRHREATRTLSNVCEKIGISGGEPYYSSRPVIKEQGQGDFDNIHIAPPMTAEKVLSPSLVNNPKNKEKTVNITMAPICEHDCLHLHWRWGKYSASVPFPSPLRSRRYGWSGGKPFNKAGAPLVPENQDVQLQLVRNRDAIAPHGFRYKATMFDIRSGKWQFTFHHGMAYGVGLELGVINQKFFDQMSASYINEYVRAGFLPKPNNNELPWSVLYLALRYKLYNGVLHEKLRFPDLHSAITG